MPTDMNSELPNEGNQESFKTESRNSTAKISSPLVDAWRKTMAESTLTPQEKIEATKVLMKLRQAQEKNKALFATLGLGHNGLPLDKAEKSKSGKLK